MRILYITGYYPPPETACGIRAYYFVRELVRRRHEVLVIEMNSRAPSTGTHFGEKIIRFPYRVGTISRALDLFKKVYVYERIVRNTIEKNFKPDIIISSWPTHDAALLGHKLSTSLKIPLILDIQDLSDYYRGMEGEGITDPIAKMLLFNNIYRAMLTAWKVVTVTEPFKRIIELRTNRKDIELVYNGADVQEFEIIRNTLISSNTEKDVIGVFLGDLSWHYHMLDRILYALYTLRRSARTLENLRLKIVGSGKYLQSYKELTSKLGLNDVVVFTGYLRREDLVRTLILSDFGIIGRPAINNLWIKASVRTTLYEYMAAGLPVFSFGPENSYTQYLIRRNNLGMYVCSDNPKLIAIHMLRFLSTLRDLNRDAIRKTSWLYDWSRLAKRFAALVEKIE